MRQFDAAVGHAANFGGVRDQQNGVVELVMQIIEQAFDWLDAPPARVHQEDVPMPYAANLEALSLPSVEKIVKAAKAVCYR